MANPQIDHGADGRIDHPLAVAIDSIRDQLFTAIRTLVAIPDRETGWLAVRSAWPDTLREEAEEWAKAVEAGGRYEAMRLERVRPSPSEIDAMIPCLLWMVWLDERERAIMWMRAFSVPWWKIAGRFEIRERTAHYWMRDAIEKIARRIARGEKPRMVA